MSEAATQSAAAAAVAVAAVHDNTDTVSNVDVDDVLGMTTDNLDDTQQRRELYSAAAEHDSHDDDDGENSTELLSDGDAAAATAADDDDDQHDELLSTTDERLTMILALDAECQTLQQAGDLIPALAAMEKSLVLRGHVYGVDSIEVAAACVTVASFCNYVAMLYLSAAGETNTKSDNAIDATNSVSPIVAELLAKAEVLSERSASMLAVTYNNYACYYRKTRKLRIALKYGLKAVELEDGVEAERLMRIQQRSSGSDATADDDAAADDDKSNNLAAPATTRADTHLNVCTILSELKRYNDALSHARTALKFLLLELFGTRPGDEHDAQQPPADRVSVLAIAYHNLAVQQEHLNLYSDALASYEKALKVANTYLGGKHALTISMRASLKSASSKLSSKIASTQRGNAKPPPVEKPSLDFAATVRQLGASLSNTTLSG